MKKTNCSMIDAYSCLEAGGRVWHGVNEAELTYDKGMTWKQEDPVNPWEVITDPNGWICEWPDPENNEPENACESPKCKHCKKEIHFNKHYGMWWHGRENTNDLIYEQCILTAEPEDEPTVDLGDEKKIRLREGYRYKCKDGCIFTFTSTNGYFCDNETGFLYHSNGEFVSDLSSEDVACYAVVEELGPIETEPTVDPVEYEDTKERKTIKIIIDGMFRNIGVSSDGRVLTGDVNYSKQPTKIRIDLPEGNWEIDRREKNSEYVIIYFVEKNCMNTFDN